jgi:FlaA1/EpsC-like NDP-sugar epimerase
MIQRILSLPKSIKQLSAVLLDVFILFLVAFISLSIYDGDFELLGENLMLIIVVPFISVPVFIYCGIYKELIRYIGFDYLTVIFKAASTYSILLAIYIQIIDANFILWPFLILNWSLCLTLITSLRIFGKWFFSDLNDKFPKGRKNVVVYGAGSAGRQLVIALSQSKEYKPAAFLDDSSALQKNFINGIEVFHPNNFVNLIKILSIDEVFLAIPSASRGRRKEIIKILDQFPVLVKSLPGVAEIAQGKVKIIDLHEININDLLGREPAPPNESLLSLNIKEKVVMVTGAGGSIGSELCRQIILLDPKAIVLYELNEFALYQIEKELSEINNNVVILPFLGSVTNFKRLKYIFKKISVQTIYHAAAYKHVPLVELNTIEGIANNIYGTLNCAKAAIKTNVETFVLISSDKAVRPTNIMGATKRFSEMILQALANNQTKTRFTMVRFGNVLGSSGSVIPLFTEQIKKGGPLTVTDSKMTRYFMTISEAVGLVIQAGAMGEGGDVFVLDMGEPISIKKLAEKMINLSGLEIKSPSNLDGDIEIIYTGIRPGEKLYEELFISENCLPTINPLILTANEEMLTWSELEEVISDLDAAIDQNNHIVLREILIRVISEFKPSIETSDLLDNIS